MPKTPDLQGHFKSPPGAAPDPAWSWWKHYCSTHGHDHASDEEALDCALQTLARLRTEARTREGAT